jgi:hypothetical protein
MNNLLVRAEKWLGELGIKTERAGTAVKINRDAIANWPTDPDSLLGELKKEFGPRLCWGAKDDEWLYLESY